MHVAHDVYYSRDEMSRGILEARLLTREGPATVANRFGATVGVVDAYERLFFNVPDRLDQPDWIRAQVLSMTGGREPTPTAQTQSTTLPQVYRHIAYHGGALALDLALDGVARSPLPKSPEKLAH